MPDRGKWWDATGHTTMPSQEARQEIASRVRAIRKAKGLRSVDAAKLLGREPSAYSDLERNGTMSLGSLLQISDLYGVPPSAMLPDDTDEDEQYQRGRRHGYLEAIEKLQGDIPQ